MFAVSCAQCHREHNGCNVTPKPNRRSSAPLTDGDAFTSSSHGFSWSSNRMSYLRDGTQARFASEHQNTSQQPKQRWQTNWRGTHPYISKQCLSLIITFCTASSARMMMFCERAAQDVTQHTAPEAGHHTCVASNSAFTASCPNLEIMCSFTPRSSHLPPVCNRSEKGWRPATYTSLSHQH